jgi:hypothetical protein
VVEAVDAVEDAGLAGAVGADDAEKLTGAEGKREPVHRRDASEAKRQPLNREYSVHQRDALHAV